MNIFEELISTNQALKDLQTDFNLAKEKFDKETIELTEQIIKVKEDEVRLREEVMETLKQNDEQTVSINDKTITKQVKTTLKILTPVLLLASISANTEKLRELGINVKELQEEAFKKDIVINPEYRKQLLDIAGQYNDIENKLFDGIEQVETEFITIKNN